MWLPSIAASLVSPPGIVGILYDEHASERDYLHLLGPCSFISLTWCMRINCCSWPDFVCLLVQDEIKCPTHAEC